MNVNKALLVALVLSVCLAGFLTYKGWEDGKADLSETSVQQEPTKQGNSEVDVMSTIEKAISGGVSSPQEVQEVMPAFDKAYADGLLSLDQQLFYGKLKIENSPAPMAGISVLRQILATDSNHVPTIQTLGEMSIRTGQWKKAKERYQKLLSLQPENAEYRQALDRICHELGDTDCL